MSSTISPDVPEAVAHADTHERQGKLRQKLSDGTAQPADDRMLFSSDNAPRLPSGCEDGLPVEGLDGKCIDDPAETPFFRKRFGSLESLSISTPHATMVTSLPSRKTFARPTSNTEFSSYTQGTEARPIRDVDGPGVSAASLMAAFAAAKSAGTSTRMLGQHAHKGDVFDHLMAATVRGQRKRRRASERFSHRGSRSTGIANLVIDAPRAEYRKRAGERNLSRQGKTGGNADHVLLCNADIEKTLGVARLRASSWWWTRKGPPRRRLRERLRSRVPIRVSPYAARVAFFSLAMQGLLIGQFGNGLLGLLGIGSFPRAILPGLP